MKHTAVILFYRKNPVGAELTADMILPGSLDHMRGCREYYQRGFLRRREWTENNRQRVAYSIKPGQKRKFLKEVA